MIALFEWCARQAVKGAILAAVMLASTAAWADIAIRGFDAVAYFTENAAVQGSPMYTAEWVGSTWRFASAEHRDLFLADPVRYAPQFGGFCTGAIGNGIALAADPEAWRIVDGRLYLFADKSGLSLDFDADPESAINAAAAQWPQVQSDLQAHRTVVIGQ